jgi:hypothetical protein
MRRFSVSLSPLCCSLLAAVLASRAHADILNYLSTSQQLATDIRIHQLRILAENDDIRLRTQDRMPFQDKAVLYSTPAFSRQITDHLDTPAYI